MQQQRSKVPFFIAAIVGVLLIGFVRGAFTSDREPDPSDGPPQAGDCVTVNLAASSEKAELLKQIAAAFHKTNPRAGGRCARINTYSKASGGAADALARGWDDAIDGERPDVWSPASSSWTVIVRQRLAARDQPNLIPEDLPSVAQTPLVIAMPRAMATELGWPRKAIGWSDVLKLARDPSGWGSVEHPEWGRFRLGKTNPNFSTSGLNATIGAYFAATGLSSDLTRADVDSKKVRGFVRDIESSVVHYGDTTLTFLENLQKADEAGAGLTYISAVTVEEKSVWDYNKGNPTGNPATLGDRPPPRTPLVAIYPKEGTLLSDNPYVILDAPWVDEPKKEAARAFLRFLQQPAQQRRFQAAAFRDFRGRPGAEINERNGMLPARVTVISPPAPNVLDRIQASWAELRKRARVTLVIDVSGSMGESVPDAGETKLELAKRAAIRALDQFSKDDELALWIFSSGEFPNTRDPYLELLEMGRLGPRIDRFRERIRSLVPRGGTALYATARAVTRTMREDLDPERINAVVFLTDGKNEYPPDTNLESLLRELRAESEETSVRVFPIAYGEDADLGVLRQIAEASRAAAYDASDPASIDKIFTAVVSNF